MQGVKRVVVSFAGGLVAGALLVHLSGPEALWFGSRQEPTEPNRSDDEDPAAAAGQDVAADQGSSSSESAVPAGGPSDTAQELAEADDSHTETFVLGANSNLSATLRSAGLASTEIAEIAASAKGVTNLARIAAGSNVVVTWEGGEDEIVSDVVVDVTSDSRLVFRAAPDRTWTARIESLPSEFVTRVFSGTISDSLWASAQGAGLDADVISAFADVFAWQIDFTRELRAGDSWRVMVQEKRVNSERVGWGPILAAEYAPQDGRVLQGVHFPKESSENAYFRPDGTSLKEMFLKAPIKFKRITSRFSKSRFHPVLGIRRPHYGVDYGARPGTPIHAVGDGVVVMREWFGGHGRFLKIRHNNRFSTSYSHLSTFVASVQRGKKVQQGDVIGYVGSSGLATGPHLHFAFYEDGRYIDPLGRRFSPAPGIGARDKAEFAALAAARLDEMTRALATTANADGAPDPKKRT